MASAAERYTALSRARESVLRQAREASRLSIPGLIPAEGSSDPHDVSEQPYTSLVARGVNNVSAKLLVTFFPPERPFFKLDVDSDTAADLGNGLGAVQAKLAGISLKAMALVEASASRTMWMEVFRHLVVAGNMLVYHPLDGSKMRAWRLDQYVVKRDAQGNLVEAVIREQVYPSELEEDVRIAVGLQSAAEKKDEDRVDLYTWVRRERGRIVHFEEIEGVEVAGSRGSAKIEEAGWQALRWQEVPGSDYGRAYVTEYAGDILTLEDASAAVLKFAAEASRILRIVDPNSGVDVDELARAESGDFLTGFADKIQTLQLDKSQDFQVLWEVVQLIERRISQAFLLTANTIRNAERVTAEEIKAVAQELEDAFGGTYSVLSTEVQKPYARRLLFILTRSGKAPKLPDAITPSIVTGFAALGQNHETAALRDWLADLTALLGPEWVQTRLDGEEIAKRLAVGRGVVSAETLIKSQQTVADEQAQALQSQAALSAAPQIAKGAIDAMNQEQAPVQP